MRGPVSLVTVGGFLGAGKTTLINRILSQANEQRYVVFVNDFGDINIDYDLIETVEEDRVSLKNGCVCCSLNADLIETIATFCRDQAPDAILIEASGVADPRSLDNSLMPLVQAGYINLDYKIYLLDVDQIGRLDYADTEMLIDQALASDLVVLNKCDLVDPSQLSATKRLLTQSGNTATIIDTTFANLPLESLLLIDPGERNFTTPKDGMNHGHFASWSRQNIAPLTFRAFEKLLEATHPFVLRAKGRVYFEDDPQQLVDFDVVGHRRVFRKRSASTTGMTPAVIFIGRKETFRHDVLDAFFCDARSLVDSPD